MPIRQHADLASGWGLGDQSPVIDGGGIALRVGPGLATLTLKWPPELVQRVDRVARVVPEPRCGERRTVFTNGLVEISPGQEHISAVEMGTTFADGILQAVLSRNRLDVIDK